MGQLLLIFNRLNLIKYSFRFFFSAVYPQAKAKELDATELEDTKRRRKDAGSKFSHQKSSADAGTDKFAFNSEFNRFSEPRMLHNRVSGVAGGFIKLLYLLCQEKCQVN